MISYHRSRRAILKTCATAVVLGVAPSIQAQKKADMPWLRLGGPVPAHSPEDWIRELKVRNYRAAYCPVGNKADAAIVRAYVEAAKKADITIAEVGAWSNPISPEEKTRTEARDYCRKQLDLADRVGARCCVNVSGSRGPSKSGPSPENLTKETFEMIVETTRSIIDAVKPSRTYFTLEAMPWSYPDSADNYLRLIKAIDRKQFAVHLDPVNLICSPQRYFRNGDLIRECFKKLGRHLRSCHAKDTLLDTKLTTHLDEVRPGLGKLDYSAFLRELSNVPEVPLMLEHLKTQDEYALAADYIRSVTIL